MQGLPTPNRFDITSGSAKPYVKPGDCPATLKELQTVENRTEGPRLYCG